MLPKLTLGCDPELFVAIPGEGLEGGVGINKLIPAFDFLPDKRSSGEMFWDGFQAEFTVKPGETKDIVSGIWKQMKALKKVARLHNPKAELLLQDCFWLDAMTLNGAANEHVALGCDPSINIYGTHPFIPENPRDLPLRFAGGHIHFGSDLFRAEKGVEERVAKFVPFIQALDLVLGLFSVCADSPVETIRQRRNFYGLAGEVRCPDHGIEYRTLSPFWFGHPKLAWLTLEMARAVYIAQWSGLTKFCQVDNLNQFINTYDLKSSRSIWKSVAVIQKILRQTLTATEIGMVNDIASLGVSNVIANSRDVSVNWRLDKEEEKCPFDS